MALLGGQTQNLCPGHATHAASPALQTHACRPSPPLPSHPSQVPKSVASQLQSSNLEFIDIIEYNPAFISASPYRIFVRTESPFLKDKLVSSPCWCLMVWVHNGVEQAYRTPWHGVACNSWKPNPRPHDRMCA